MRYLPIRRSIDAAGQGWPRITIVDILLTALLAGAVAFIGLFGVRILELAHLLPAAAPTAAEATVGPVPISYLAAEPIAIFLAVYLMIILRGRATWKEIGYRAFQWRWILMAVIAALLCLMVSGLVSRIIDPYYKTSLVEEYSRLLGPSAQTPVRTVLLFAIVGVFVPAAEETFFRGMFYGWLRARWGPAVGAVVSALVFAAAHGSPRIGPQIFVIGIVLAWLYERSRSLFASIIAHGTVNTISLVMILYYANGATG